MDIVIPRGLRFGRKIAIVWAAHSVIWQFAIYFTHELDGIPLIRFIYFALKPIILASLIMNGRIWPKLVVGCLGLIEGLVCLILGLFYIDELGGATMVVGGLIYSILAYLVLNSRDDD